MQQHCRKIEEIKQTLAWQKIEITLSSTNFTMSYHVKLVHTFDLNKNMQYVGNCINKNTNVINIVLRYCTFKLHLKFKTLTYLKH